MNHIKPLIALLGSVMLVSCVQASDFRTHPFNESSDTAQRALHTLEYETSKESGKPNVKHTAGVLKQTQHSGTVSSLVEHPSSSAKPQSSNDLSNDKKTSEANIVKSSEEASKDLGTPATVLDSKDYSSLIGSTVYSQKGEDMGRIIDMIIDRSRSIKAVVIDFGGFLGVGSRKIAVDWNALAYSVDGKRMLTLQLSKDRLRITPEFKFGEPAVIIGPLGPTKTGIPKITIVDSGKKVDRKN